MMIYRTYIIIYDGSDRNGYKMGGERYKKWFVLAIDYPHVMVV